MQSDTPESVTLVPIDRIEVLNSRDRNMKIFEEIVENRRASWPSARMTRTCRMLSALPIWPPKFDSKSGIFAVCNFLMSYFSMSYSPRASCFGEVLL